MEVVERALTTIITQEHPAYAQLWTSLTTPQKKVLKAVILEGGRGGRPHVGGRAPAPWCGGSHNAQDARRSRRQGIIREDEAEASPRYKLEDPFFGAWLRHVQEAGHA